MVQKIFELVQLNQPQSICFTSDFALYVEDCGNGTIIELKNGQQLGTVVFGYDTTSNML